MITKPRVTTSAQRVAAAVNNVNQPAFCGKCGSVYFTEVQASMYTPGSNGFRGISTVPMKVYRCVCG